MLIRKLIAAALLVAAPVSLLPVAIAAQVETATPSVTELLEITSFDQVFTQFASTMEEAAALDGSAPPVEMERAWREAAREVFAADKLHVSLTATLEGRISPAEAGAVAAFYNTALGRKVGRMDRTTTTLDPAAQLHALVTGGAILEELGEDSPRVRRFNEMLELVSADLAATITAQSVRGMLIGMSVAPQQGDIQIPWNEIEAELETIMGNLEAEMAASQQAMLAFAYRGLSDAELEDYLEFLRTPAARKFYSLAVMAVAAISSNAIMAFGEALVAKLASVDA